MISKYFDVYETIIVKRMEPSVFAIYVFFFLNKINVRLAQPQSINIFFVYKVESDWQAAIARVSMPQHGYVTLHL